MIFREVSGFGVAFLCFSNLGGKSEARPTSAKLIPNGHSVPHPGPQGGIWAGVGHLNAGGGGALNPFGLDFRSNGFVWTPELCEKDSDGDGRSNGVELGDPDCVWSVGEEPKGPALSHPGIPDSPRDNVILDTCENYVEPPDVEKLDIRFSQVNTMDETRTHYICEQKEITAPTFDTNIPGYHQVKTSVALDNSEVLHHIWIYLCDGVDSSDGEMVGEGPYSCDGVEANCYIVAGWAVGARDFCEPPNVASWFGFSGGRATVKIEAHYDNASGMPQSDQSGMILSLTPTLRPLDSSLVILGMDYWDRQFEIPSGVDRYELTNICPTTATTRALGNQPIWVYSWNPHMHLYGRKLVTEHYRCGKKIGELGRIEDFEFDNQQSYIFESPVKVLPGDALVTTCTFDTSDPLDNADVILGGESTTEEMCDNYLTYYPFVGTNARPNLFSACSSFNRGTNPKFSGFDDRTPFVSLDLGGDVFVRQWESEPELNVAPCCATNTCESEFLSREREPCAINDDCEGALICSGGLCEVKPSDGGGGNKKKCRKQCNKSCKKTCAGVSGNSCKKPCKKDCKRDCK